MLIPRTHPHNLTAKRLDRYWFDYIEMTEREESRLSKVLAGHMDAKRRRVREWVNEGKVPKGGLTLQAALFDSTLLSWLFGFTTHHLGWTGAGALAGILTGYVYKLLQGGSLNFENPIDLVNAVLPGGNRSDIFYDAVKSAQQGPDVTIEIRPVEADHFERLLTINTGRGAQNFYRKAIAGLPGALLDIPPFPLAVLEWLTDRVPMLADDLDRKTLEGIQYLVLENYMEGGDILKLQTAIEEFYTDWIRSKPDLIARTETHMIQAMTEYETLDQMSIASDIIKIWTTAKDGQYDTHASPPRENWNPNRRTPGMEGEKRKWRERFSNGLLYPKEPSGPAHEVIRCRCTLLYEFPSI